MMRAIDSELEKLTPQQAEAVAVVCAAVNLPFHKIQDVLGTISRFKAEGNDYEN
jgi:hypothetical protein